jgi:hypothetical protein
MNIFKKKISAPTVSIPRIIRTKIIKGKSIPAFIHNSGYYFTNIDVYEDGAIWCWHTDDLATFKSDLERRWVSTAIPNGGEISIHGLGNWKIDNGHWLYDARSFYDHVFGIVKEMNPKLQNMYKFVEKNINGIGIIENSMGEVYREDRRYEHEISPPISKGDSYHLFYKVSDSYLLARFAFFADEKIEITGLADPIYTDLRGIEQDVTNGIVLSEIPSNSVVEIAGLGSFTAVSCSYAVRVEDKLLEARDIIEKLNGRPTSLETCRQVYEEYLETPNRDLKDLLKTAYEKIPTHERRYVGDMDTKDTGVRMVIYGKQAIENWSHYQVAKQMGDELPSINIPEPEDES